MRDLCRYHKNKISYLQEEKGNTKPRQKLRPADLNFSKNANLGSYNWSNRFYRKRRSFKPTVSQIGQVGMALN